MTQAFNLSQFANKVNTSGQADLITAVSGTLPIANGGTGLTAVGTSGNVLTSNGSAWTSATPPALGTVTNGLRVKSFQSGTTYTVSSDVKSFYVFVFGAMGSCNAVPRGGVGGSGYSEKYYASPAASYSFAIGAGSATNGNGGTTTFGGVISVSGSGGITGAGGSAGGAGSGGDYNATGGIGGSGNYNNGGPGGAGSRAGNGGNGGNGASGVLGGGGGTGGNNASGATAGGAATTKAAGAITLPWNPQIEFFDSGFGGISASGKFLSEVSSINTTLWNISYVSGLNTIAISTGGASVNIPAYGVVSNTVTTIPAKIPYSENNNGSPVNTAGLIVILEVLK